MKCTGSDSHVYTLRHDQFHPIALTPNTVTPVTHVTVATSKPLLLVGMDTATNFLITDRRGRILSEIAEGLKSEIDYSDGKTRPTKVCY